MASTVAEHFHFLHSRLVAVSPRRFPERRTTDVSNLPLTAQAEAGKVSFYHRAAARQQQQQQAWLQKRRQENAARRAAGEDPLPEEEPGMFKPIPEPSQLDNVLIANQIDACASPAPGTARDPTFWRTRVHSVHLSRAGTHLALPAAHLAWPVTVSATAASTCTCCLQAESISRFMFAGTRMQSTVSAARACRSCSCWTACSAPHAPDLAAANLLDRGLQKTKRKLCGSGRCCCVQNSELGGGGSMLHAVACLA